MTITTKKGLCVLNAALSALAFLLLHATMWLMRGEETPRWLYFDLYTLFIISSVVALACAIGMILSNLQKNNVKIRMMVSAVVNAIPTITLTVIFSTPGDFTTTAIMQMWRLFVAMALYYVVAILYLVIAFVKTKQVDKADEPIPYSD